MAYDIAIVKCRGSGQQLNWGPQRYAAPLKALADVSQTELVLSSPRSAHCPTISVRSTEASTTRPPWRATPSLPGFTGAAFQAPQPMRPSPPPSRAAAWSLSRRHVSQAPQPPDRAAEVGRGCSCEAEGAPIPSRSTLSVIRSVDVHGCAPTSGGSTECQAPVTRRGLEEEEPRGVGRTASGPCCIRRPVQTPQPLSAEAVCVRRDVSRNRPKPSKARRFGLPHPASGRRPTAR